MVLHDLVMTGAARHPQRPALFVDDEVTTFAELAGRVDALAAAVSGVAAPGDRVAFVAANGPEWIDAYYAVPKAGCVLGFVNHRLGAAALRAAVERLRPAVLMADTEALTTLAATGPVAALAPVIITIDPSDPSDPGNPGDPSDPSDPSADDAVVYRRFVSHPRPSASRPPIEPQLDDTAWLIATSGTSGTPKVVALSHGNLIAAVEGTLAVRPIAADDVYLFPFPLCHVAGYNVLMSHHAGRPVVLARRFTPAALVEQIVRHHVTSASLAPTMIDATLDHLDRAGGSLAPLRSVNYGSSAIAPGLLRRAVAQLGVDFNQGYGMTELAGNAVFLGPDDHRRGLGPEPSLLTAAGRPGRAVEVVLLDDAGALVATGGDGEVAVRGEQVMKGYWEAPEANAAAFHDGWFRTGDIGRFDPAGVLSIVDRKKDIIVSGGENISSLAVEDQLASHPDIAEVAVVGAPDARWGEVVCAFVVARPGAPLESEEVLAFGRRAIGGFQQPRRVEVVDALPRNGSGKVLKHELRARL